MNHNQHREESGDDVAGPRDQADDRIEPEPHLRPRNLERTIQQHRIFPQREHGAIIGQSFNSHRQSASII